MKEISVLINYTSAQEIYTFNIFLRKYPPIDKRSVVRIPKSQLQFIFRYDTKVAENDSAKGSRDSE